MTASHHPTVLFDWGDTVMKDNPVLTIPMVEWESVQAVEGIGEVLEYLRSNGRRCILATSANISDEGQIRGALARAGLASHFERIYCVKNTGLQKGEAFYRFILDEMQIPAGKALMVGDHFEKDVLIPNRLGMFGIWFNPHSDERRKGILHETVHSMEELLAFWRALDREVSHA